MPTPTGKPKVGERIEVRMPGHPPRYAKVLRRYDGLCWGLEVLADDENRPRIIGEAGWMMKKGYLTVVEGDTS